MLNTRQRWLLVVSLMLAMFVGAIDQTVVSTATPSILADLGGFGLLSWLFTSYLLSSTVVVPLVGKLSDIFGRKVFVLVGVAVFMVSSAACGAAPSMPFLIIVRAFQGVGGGMIFASVFATIGDIFPPAERGKYTGLFVGTFSLASLLGPTLGGFLTDTLSWRWVFYINVPFSLAAMPAIWMNLPYRRNARRPQIDFLGAGLLSSASVLLLLGLVWAGDKYAWGSAEIIGIFAGSAVFTGLFVWQESRHPEPMLPLHLFRNRVFVIANLVVFTLGLSTFGAVQYLPTFVQTALGASATVSGIITTPQSLGLLFTSIIGGQIITRTGRYRGPAMLGTFVAAGAVAMLATMTVHEPRWRISLFMVILGLGSGLVGPTMSIVVQNAVPYRLLGVATSSTQFFRQIGSVLGAAIFGALLASSYHTSFQDNVPSAVRDQVPAATLAEFDDPTLGIDPRKLAIVREQVSALPGGEALFAQASLAQRDAVAHATRVIFATAAGIAALAFLATIFLKELPLRRDFLEEGEAGDVEMAAAAGGH
jgi:EmrB/QacA subfamily drug resistance transporter